MSNMRFGLRTFKLREVRTLGSNVLPFDETGFFTDIFGVPDLAFSLRKLSPNNVYSGAAFRVRRSNDNAEQDIHFLSGSINEIIDTTDLLNFVGAGNNGFVTTWYDQSGNDRHVRQTTGANQPRIVISGVLNQVNGLPAITTDVGSGNVGLSTAGNYNVPTSISFITVIKPISHGSAYHTIWSIGPVQQNAAWIEFTTRTGFSTQDWINGDVRFTGDGYGSGRNPRFISNGQAFFTGNDYIAFGTLGSAASSVDINNSSVSASVSGTGNVGTNNSNFNLLGSVTNEAYLGDIQELIFYGSNKTSDKTSMTDNLNDYYNVF